MTLLVLTLALAQAQATAAPRRETPEAAARAERAFFDQVSLSLTLDRDSYYVGEPVRLRVTMRNIGSKVVRGYLDVVPFAETSEIYYRRKGEAFRRFKVAFPHAEEVNVQSAPRA